MILENNLMCKIQIYDMCNRYETKYVAHALLATNNFEVIDIFDVDTKEQVTSGFIKKFSGDVNALKKGITLPILII